MACCLIHGGQNILAKTECSFPCRCGQV